MTTYLVGYTAAFAAGVCWGVLLLWHVCARRDVDLPALLGDTVGHAGTSVPQAPTGRGEGVDTPATTTSRCESTGAPASLPAPAGASVGPHRTPVPPTGGQTPSAGVHGEGTSG